MNPCRLLLASSVLCAGVWAAGGCAEKGDPAASWPPPAPPAPPVASAPAGPRVVNASLRDVGLDPDALDRRVDACQDFFQFACGGWLAKAQIPADKSRWSRSFNEIYDRNEAELHEILEGARKAYDASGGGAKAKAAARGAPPSTPAPSGATADDPRSALGAYYGACMDETAVEAAGTKGLTPLMNKAKGVNNAASLAAAIIELHKRGIWAVFDVNDEQDHKDATRVIATLDQDGLGLPDRDYYVNDDEKSKTIRATYLDHVKRMMGLVGMRPAQAAAAANDVMSVETEIAKISKTRVERRDPSGMYNRVEREGLAKHTPSFPWDAYFKGLGFADLREVSVTSVPFFDGFDKLIKTVKPAQWRNYLQWQIVHTTAGALPKAFVDEAFKLDAALTGKEAQRPRWKRCVEATDHALGDYLAKPYVDAKFAGQSKDAARAMVLAVSDTFGRDLSGLDWMDPTTRARAEEKRKHMAYLIGYPAKWRTYDFAVTPKDFSADLLAARAFDLQFHLNRVGKPVDRGAWDMTPPTVNAYYDPQKNQMVFPAGILQPPFYDAKAADAVNLGAMGMVVGHELTHGFDDEGSQYAGSGNLENWWTPAVKEKFDAKKQCLIDQYGSYEPVPGVKLNGKLTLGENIADNGGVKTAFRTYRQLRANAAEVTVADGFNEDQQFFLAVGQAWCSKDREPFARMLVTVDPHSPAKFRVIGSLTNQPEFAQAFKCAEGTPMHPKKTCEVW